VEEKIGMRVWQKFWGKGTRGRGTTSVAKDSEKEDEATSSQNTRGGKSVGSGRGFGRGKYVITCYRCGVDGHKASRMSRETKCSEKN
jgi:hypothetical protein